MGGSPESSLNANTLHRGFRDLLRSRCNLHGPVSVGQTAVIPSERVQIRVCLFLYGWYYAGLRLQIWVRLICVISTYSNRAVQIWVGLELAEITQLIRKQVFSVTDVCVCVIGRFIFREFLCVNGAHKKYLTEAPKLHKIIPASTPYRRDVLCHLEISSQTGKSYKGEPGRQHKMFILTFPALTQTQTENLKT